MKYSRIVGTGSYLPEKILTNHDLEKMVDTSDEWIRSRSGIRERHIAADGEVASDLAHAASTRAIASAGLTPSDIDLVIVATTTPDMVFPSTACILQSKLGIGGCPAFDVQAVCSGFIYAISIANMFICSGQATNALIVGTEVYSRILDWTDRTTCVLFGDGAGAVVLSGSDEPGVLATKLHADGSYSDKLSVPGWVCGGKTVGSPFVQMDGGSVFKFAVRVFEEVAHEEPLRHAGGVLLHGRGEDRGVPDSGQHHSGEHPHPVRRRVSALYPEDAEPRGPARGPEGVDLRGSRASAPGFRGPLDGQVHLRPRDFVQAQVHDSLRVSHGPGLPR